MRFTNIVYCLFVITAVLRAQNFECNLQEYKPQPGLKAELTAAGLVVTWQGEHGTQLRSVFAAHEGQPVIRELSARKQGGRWLQLGSNLTPEYQVTTGRRRMSEQQLEPLRKLGIPITRELLDREQWNAFWDAPLNRSGQSRHELGSPAPPGRDPAGLGELSRFGMQRQDRWRPSGNYFSRRGPRNLFGPASLHGLSR